MTVRIDVGEDGRKEARLLAIGGQRPAERLAEPLDALDEGRVRPVLLGEALQDFAGAAAASCEERVRERTISTMQQCVHKCGVLEISGLVCTLTFFLMVVTDDNEIVG